jgi:hypothetical protein
LLLNLYCAHRILSQFIWGVGGCYGCNFFFHGLKTYLVFKKKCLKNIKKYKKMKHIRWHFFPIFFFFLNIRFFSQPGNNKYLLFEQTLEKLGQTHVSNGYIYGKEAHGYGSPFWKFKPNTVDKFSWGKSSLDGFVDDPIPPTVWI